MKPSAVLLVVLAIGGAACGSTPTQNTPVIISGSTEVFSGTLSALGSAFYSFKSLSNDPVDITMASLTSVASGAPFSQTLRLAVGIPAGTGCGPLASYDAAPSLTPQVSVPLTPGTYCVSLTDPGVLTGDTHFAIRISQGDLTFGSLPSPETFASHLSVLGASTHTFVVSGASGTTASVSVSLDSVTPSTVVGLGLGIWELEKSACDVNQAVASGPGAQLSATVGPGIFCVKIYDVGNLTDTVAFSASIIHP